MQGVRLLAITLFLSSLLTGCGSTFGEESPDGYGKLVGTIAGPADEVLVGATVEIGNLQTESLHDGSYAFKSVPAGQRTLRVGGLAWLKDVEMRIQIDAAVENQKDIKMEAWPMQLLSADQQLVTQFIESQTDWTEQRITVGVANKPTKAEIERILYLHNPALIRKPPEGVLITPEPDPTFSAQAAVGFDFVVPPQEGQLECDQAGRNAVEIQSIQNDMPHAFSQAAKEQLFMWPAMELDLMRWDFEVAKNVYCVGQAIRNQKWSSQAELGEARPQSVQQTVLISDEVWIEVVFEPWVDVSDSISDSDSDGRKEVFAKVVEGAFSNQILSYLRNQYAGQTLGTYELGLHLETLMSDFYNWTDPKLTNTIGSSFGLTGFGEIQYPFAVMSHDDGKIDNVFLVSP